MAAVSMDATKGDCDVPEKEGLPRPNWLSPVAVQDAKRLHAAAAKMARLALRAAGSCDAVKGSPLPVKASKFGQGRKFS
ncbi:hypothetical protein [Mesorhizobium xinjiangense]|uniref:hypothetical protein n=1 Tax=Mesorhizobium xinjiangense TaxID=2678685 RepID=UPI0012EE1316|nr:hypothetical protein [Mesorhizobium xinjiangense]